MECGDVCRTNIRKRAKNININTKFLDKVSEMGQKLPLRFKDYLLFRKKS